MLNYRSQDFSQDKLKKAIAIRMHEERKKAGFTLQGLADKLHYGKPTVYSWEKGWKKTEVLNKIPTWDQLIAICQLYNCEMGYILCEFDQRTSKTADICQETGLTEPCINTLKYLLSTELCTAREQSDLILAFINTFIIHSVEFSSIFRRLREYSRLKDMLETDNDKKIIEKCYKYQPFLFDIDDNLDPGKFHAAQTVIEKYLIELGDPHSTNNIERIKRATEIHKKIMDYIPVLGNNLMKISNFEISDTFLDITKNFFSELKENTEEYEKLVESIRKQENKTPNMKTSPCTNSIENI